MDVTNEEMTIDIAALEAYSLTNLFARIADTYYAGLSAKSEAAESIQILVEAKLASRTRSRVHLTARGWSVATRLSALDGACLRLASPRTGGRSRSMTNFYLTPRFCYSNPMHNLGHALSRVGVLVATPILSQARDWKVANAARGIEHDLQLAYEAGEDGGIYRQRAMRRAIGLSADLRPKTY